MKTNRVLLSNIQNKNTFSIIIPTFNRGERLKIALNSLESQTYKNFEIIICDDGSTDNTKEIVESFKNKLTIQYIWNENWGGPARPRNIGIQASQTDWICFLDSDDWWYPNKLEICLDFMDRYNVIYHDLDIYTGNGKVPSGKCKGRKLKGNYFSDLIINGNALCNSSVIVKKTLINKIGGISEEQALVAVEDYDCWIRIAQIDNKFKYLKKSLGGYWLGDNISSASEKIIHAEEFVTNKYINLLSEKDKNQTFYHLKYKLGRLYQKLNENNKALDYFKKSVNSKSYAIKLKSFFLIFVLFIKRLLA
jgi:glycosyltransferase involved in cell wall biosynthesis